MAKSEAPLEALADYLPPGTYEHVVDYLHRYKVHLTVSRQRASVLGDYRNATADRHHRISVNGNLNRYAFLITLLHELAHLLTFDRFGHTVSAHGKEWKAEFGRLLAQFLQHHVFPPDIHKALSASLRNPAASSCADDDLMRVLRKYDPVDERHALVEELAEGTLFRTRDGRVFRREKVVRKRIRCIEVPSEKVYLFSPIYEVEPLER
ncbi:SprT-like domain-containing protein [Dinghuibacter silviterrae]|uniref:SprT-like family protein n=1 Tax=Dinghuibacter silviterrae TaxID=1539049 RepID=A0A4R8DUD7_9BACT|nr:SprT-like domain-containing protein [Dinghuibacter silviterrae]TDX01027.1 SprT-like family protein [Dinghuibacter silviterrae]